MIEMKRKKYYSFRLEASDFDVSDRDSFGENRTWRGDGYGNGETGMSDGDGWGDRCGHGYGNGHGCGNGYGCRDGDGYGNGSGSFTIEEDADDEKS